MSDSPLRGEVWWCETPSIGRRPVVVLSREDANPIRRRTIVAPCTTTIRDLPSQVVLEPGEDPVPRPSAVNLDWLETISTTLLVERIGRLSSGRMHEVCEALAHAAGCTST
ncbi:MAG: type II toxin-antitoxin system PemK/MazF family toxin [Aquihabitans sp.]